MEIVVNQKQANMVAKRAMELDLKQRYMGR